jgi:hypothetical protein
MRYLEGGTLKDVIFQGRLTLGDVLRLMSQVCSAIDYAHRKGVVHRDVKPSNVIIDADGEAYLTDFGIAKVLGGTSDLTKTGVAIGTPDYMAPEQCMGQPVDRRTDIYALGVMLYEMVVGRVPFRADTPMAVVIAHIHEPLTLPREIDPSVPDSVEAVIIKALAKEPDDRYQTAAELAQALEEAIRASGVVSSETTLVSLVTQAQVTRRERQEVEKTALAEEAPRARSSLRVIGMLFGVVALLLVGGLGGAWLIDRLKSTPAPGPTQAVVAPVDTLTPTPAQPTAAQPSPVGERDVYLYDSFDNPADDGSYSTTRWITGGECEAFQNGGYIQRDGILVISNLPQDGEIFCDLNVRRHDPIKGGELGAIEIGTQLSNDHTGGPVESYMTWETTLVLDGAQWEARCDQRADEDGVHFAFVVKAAENAPWADLYSRSVPGDYDRWYTLRMEADPASMTYRCLVDGRLIGEYTPDNPEELRDADFSRRLVNYRAAATSATAFIDDVRLIPPEELFVEAVPISDDCLQPPEGMIAWWPGDVDARDLAGEHHGLLVNGADFAPGMVGQAFHFEGDKKGGMQGEFVEIPGLIQTDQLQNYTIEAWVKLDTPGSPANKNERFVNIETLEIAIVLQHNGSNNPGRLHSFVIPGNGDAEGHLVVDGVLRVGVFQHVAATYDGAMMRVYLDGVEAGSLPFSAGIAPGGAWITLSSKGEPLVGSLDEVSLYNRALSGDEINAIYQAGGAGKCKP